MRVGTKLTAVTVTGVLAVLGLHGYLWTQRELALLRSDMERDHRTLARGLSLAAQVVADRTGIEAAVELLRDANERESRMTITWSAPERAARAGARIENAAASANVERDAWLVSTVPLRLRGTAGVLELRESLQQQRKYVAATARRNAIVMGEVAVLCVVIIVGSGLLFVGRPMRQLMVKVRRIGEGHLDDPLLLAQRDEIGELAREINAMCKQLEHARSQARTESERRVAAVEQMRHADRLSMVGRLASGVAHELGTPLNVVLAHAHMIKRGQSTGAAAVADAGAIEEQCERMAAIIRQLLDLARPHASDKRMLDLRDLVQRVLAMIEPVAGKHAVRLELDSAGPPLMVNADSSQIGQVIGNLVMNAIQAQPQGGVVRVTLSQLGDEARLRFTDLGSGIPDDDRERIFEPFFTTKDPGEGTGLGLTVSFGIVRDHGGRIEVESAQGQGSSFTVYLPAGEPLFATQAIE